MIQEARAGSRRERSKDERRARIVEATYALTREVGLAAISVKMIADRAEVSPATVYNLFGTKGAVVAKVYERDLAAFERRVAEAAFPDALATIFGSITIACDVYRADPRFYLAALSERDAGLDREMLLASYRPRLLFWDRMMAQAVAEGDLRPGASPERLGVLMIQISTGALIRWVAGVISLDAMELETAYGVATVLMSLATPAALPRLSARQAEAERALAALPKLKPAAAPVLSPA